MEEWRGSERLLDLAQAAGAVEVRTDSAGSTLVLKPEGVAWTPVTLLSKAESVVAAGSGIAEPLKRSKVESMVGLARNGWGFGTFDSTRYADGDGLTFNPSLARPRSYFVALLRAVKIFEKGVPHIEHGGTDRYYRRLLSLPRDKLRRVSP